MVTIAHVPMALSTQGSTLMAVAQNLIDAAEGLDIDSAAILSDNRDVSLQGADVRYVDYTRECPRERFSRPEQAWDIAMGAAGALRPHYGRMYDPAVEAAEDLAADVVLLYEGHYAAATLPRWQPVRDTSSVVLYVQNAISRSYGRRELRRLLGGADVVAFCADHVRRRTEARLGQAPAHFTTVHNGVDPIFTPAVRDAVDEPPFSVVFAGRTTPDKGADLVLEAAGVAARAMGTRMRVEVIGSDAYDHRSSELTPYEASLRATAGRLDVDAVFLPFMPRAELAEHLRRAGVVCLPSRGPEGLPLTALEAMACGAAVITSESAGMREAVGEGGLVATIGDREGMATQIIRLATDGEALAAARSYSLTRAAEFSWDAAVARLAQLAR